MLKSIEHLFGYSFVLLFDVVCSILPRTVALKAGEWLGRVFSIVLVGRRRLVIRNLAHAFPDKDAREIAQIAQGVWKNIGRTAIEFIRLTDINRDNLLKYYIVDGQDNFDRAREKGRGVILVSMHFSNWEMIGVATAFLMGRVVAIARPIKNPYVERWIQKKRAASGLEIILHRQAVKASLRILKEKKTIGILVDQNLYTGGVFVDFFGRPAASTTLPALLHGRTQAPVVFVYCLRDGGRFRLVFEPEMQLTYKENPEERLFVQTQEIATAMERVIRKYPENWFWVHNRWKRKDPS